jgi:hypothetical protein
VAIPIAASSTPAAIPASSHAKPVEVSVDVEVTSSSLVGLSDPNR